MAVPIGQNVKQTATETSTSITQQILDQVVPDNFGDMVLKFLGAGAVTIFLIFVSRLIAGYTKRKFMESSNIADAQYIEKIGNLIYDMVFYCLFILSIFIGFQIVGFDIGIILGGISFGIGFAFQEVLGNMIAGIMLLTTKEIRLGDVIEISGTPYFGRIEEMTIRYAVIRTFDLRQVVVPNLTLITKPLKTYSAEEIVKLTTIVGVHYDTDIDFAINVVKTAINSLGIVQEKKLTNVFLGEFGDSSLNLTCFFYVNPNCGLLIEQIVGEVNNVINTALKQNNIVIPYPHLTITVDKNDQALLSSLVFLGQEYKKNKQVF